MMMMMMLRNNINLVTVFVLLGVLLPGTTCFVTKHTTPTTTRAPTRAGWPRRGDEEPVLFHTTRLQAQKKKKQNERDPKSTAAERLRALGFSDEEIAATTKQARGATKRNPDDNTNNLIGGLDPISLAAGLGVLVLLAFVFATLSDSANSPY